MVFLFFNIIFSHTLFIRKLLVRIFDKIANGTMKDGKKLSSRIIEIHKRRQGSPRKRKGPISGTKGTFRFRSEEPFYVNPLPDCLCQKESTRNENSTDIVINHLSKPGNTGSVGW
ncbi:hypothetical protein Hdeb2414_s0949g00965441 [Helianthus debilis subsp. tardiflorus]